MKSIEISRFASLSYAGQEAVNTLCTNLSFSGENMKRIMVTSTHASEGKSFLTMNIVRTMARYGKRVVLVDADLRRSTIASKHKFIFPDEMNKWGLAHLLAGMVDEKSVIYSTNIEGVFMVPVGWSVSNPLPLLNSARFPELLDHLAGMFDYVLVDAPPVGTVIDAAEIAKSCDGTLVVVNYNTVRRQELIDVKAQLEQTGCTVIGTVLNMVELDNYLSRKYYYKSYYSHYDSYNTDKGDDGFGSRLLRRFRKKRSSGQGRR
ncbi:MAG: CpsD/CapB family tyrosine-protein kinase [Candidatus Fimadaptatus sp.]